MANKRTLTIEIIGDPASASRAFKKTGDDAKRMGDRLDREGGRAHGFATITSKGFGRVGVAAGGMATAGGAAAALLAKRFISGASDINESLTKNQVLFGKYAADVDRFSKRSAAAFGISRSAALEYTGVFGNLFTALGVSSRKSSEFSVHLTKLAADMASFNNTSIDDALEAIRSGLVGETEPLRRFGVNLNDATLRQQAMSLGLTHTTKNVLTPYQRSMAAQALIVKQTAKAHGDFHRTQGGLANQTRILTARLSDASAQLGAKLLPAAVAAVKAINSLFNSTSKGGRVLATLSRAAGNATDAVRVGFGRAQAAVQRWARRHSEDIRTAGQALRNLGKAAKFVFEEVILPTIRVAVRRIGPIIQNMIGVLSGLIRFVTDVLTGKWGKAWGAMKDTVSHMLKATIGVVRATVGTLGTLALRLGGVIVKGVVKGLEGIGDAIYGQIKKGISSAADKAKNLINKVNPFGDIGDGIGKSIGDGVGIGAGGVLPSGGAFGGSLMGARTAMKPFAALGSRFGLSVTSGRRPGAITSSGNPSWHGTGEAIDMGDGRGPDANKMAFFKTLRSRFGGRLAELIYTPGGVGIKDGRPFQYTGQVAADHYDHVHVAFDSGRPGLGDGLGIGALSNLWRRAGGPGGVSNLMAHVAIAESGGDPRAYNKSGASGLWQILGQEVPGNIFNPLVNARNAVWKYQHQGLGAWAASRGSWGRYVGSGGGSSGGGRSGGSTASRRTGPYTGPRTGSVGPTTGGLGSRAQTVTGGQSAADFGLAEATARADNNLTGLIVALTNELRLKQRRAKHIRRYLKRRRVSRANRQKFTEELTQLVGDIAELKATLREYRADARGGATTISGAEALTAGVADTSGTAEAEPGPTGADFANLQIAEAALTPGTADDIAATETLLGIRQGELNAARATGDPRKILDALQAWSAVKDSLDQLKQAVDLEAETRQRMIDLLAGVKDELKAIHDEAASLNAIGYREALKFIADGVSGQVVGTNLQGRRQTAGNGRIAITP